MSESLQKCYRLLKALHHQKLAVDDFLLGQMEQIEQMERQAALTFPLILFNSPIFKFSLDFLNFAQHKVQEIHCRLYP